MSAVAVQQQPLGLRPAFKQKQHAAAPPAALTASSTPKALRTPGIITLSKPVTPSRSSIRARKSTPAATPARAADTIQPNTGSKQEPRSMKKPRSRPTSDEEEHDTPSKPRGRRSNVSEARAYPTPAASPAAKPRRNHSRTRQTPSPTESESATPSTSPALQKPSGRLAKQRRGLTKSTPALGAAAAAAPSAPVAVPQSLVSSGQPSGLSRSAPQATPAMSHTIPARMRRTLTGSEPSYRDGSVAKDVPPSPSPPRRVRESSFKSQSPLTAPLNGGAGFPSRPSHVRSPSEALFNLSLEEPDDEPQDMPILFGRATRGGDKVYAGGKFQNGPDPTMLPAPSFLSGF